jgi:uncharacterized protein (TIGR02147 family)
MSTSQVHNILNKAFLRMKKQNGSVSIRSIALKMNVSHVFLGKLLKGEVNLPAKRLNDVVKAFQLDDLATAELKEALIEKKLGKTLSQGMGKAKSGKSVLEEYEEKPFKYFTAIEHWYELPLLELMTCEGPAKTPEYLSKRLGITIREVQSALDRLTKHELAVENQGSYKKAQRYIRFPTKTPLEITQKYYQQVLKKTSEEFKKRKQQDFENRSMTNLSLAINPSKLAIVKERLQKALYEISLELTDGEAEEVYFLSTYLFPVTKNQS